MTSGAKRDEIAKIYGSTKFHGKDLYSMSDAQIHAIYGRMQQKKYNGITIFEEYEALKNSYVDLFPGQNYVARKRANNMSIFQLRDIIPKVLKEKEQKLPDLYQFTLEDWMNELQGQELQKNKQDNYITEGYLGKVE